MAAIASIISSGAGSPVDFDRNVSRDPNAATVNRARNKPKLLGRPAAFPIIFESNVGQSNPRVRFLSHGTNSTLFIAGDEALLSLPPPRSAANRRSPKPRGLSSRTVSADVLSIHFLGANRTSKVEGVGRLPGRVNYFIGRDPTRWHRNVPTWRGVVAREVWPATDLRYHGESGQLEFDIQLKPGADPAIVRMGVDGASSVKTAADGDLTISLNSRSVKLGRPRIYQQVNNRKIEVSGQFVILSHHAPRSGTIHPNADEVEIGFALGRYDHRNALIIDPTLNYSTFLGGSGAPVEGIGDSIYAIAVDGAGSAYVAGGAGSPDFPTTSSAVQTICPNTNFCDTGFVAKLDPSGSSFVYASFLGGGGGLSSGGFPQQVTGIAVNQAGEAYLTGATTYPDFPTTPNALNPTGSGGGFVTKLSADGSSLIYSTYLNDTPQTSNMGGIAIDSAGDAYVTGQAVPPYPVSSNGSFSSSPYAGAFVTELDPNGATMVFSALFSSGIGKAVALGSNGFLYMAGSDYSGNIETTPNAYQTVCAGCGGVGSISTEGFLAVINPAAPTAQQALVYSSYFGGSQPGDFYNGIDSGDAIYAMALDNLGRAYLAGVTGRTDFPVTPNAYQSSCIASQNCNNAFLAIIDPSQSGASSLTYSTLLGGSAQNIGNGLAVDGAGRAYLVGQTYAQDFPVTSNAVETNCLYCGTTSFFSAGFFTVLNPFMSTRASQLVYSTYLGGTGTTGSSLDRDAANAVALDSSGRAYIGGLTYSTDFPITAGAAQTTCPACAAQNSDAFVSKIDPIAGALLYSTFLGGSGTRGGGDGANGVALDAAGNIYVAGFSGSTDFPTTDGALQTKCRACIEYDSTMAFVSKLNPNASGQEQLVYSTYLGGTSASGDSAYSIGLDSTGDAYIAGIAGSADFPTTSSAYQPRCSACAVGGSATFLAKLDSDGSSIIYSTYLGGSDFSLALAIAVDSAGAAFLAGETFDSDFPITPNAAQSVCPACSNQNPEGFVARIDPSLSGGTSLTYSTFLGGGGIPFSVPPQGDVVYSLAVDSLGKAVVSGTTHSNDYPVSPNAYLSHCPTQSIDNQCEAAFVAIIDSSAIGSTLPYSTYFGGAAADDGYAVAVDSLNRIYFAEHTGSTDLPTSPNAYSHFCPELNGDGGCRAAFIGGLEPSFPPFAQLFYGTYLGGNTNFEISGTVPMDYPTAMAVDAGGNIYVVGYTYAPIFPTTPDAVQSTCLACSLPGIERPDPFFSELNPSASGSAQLVYSTYLGGSGQLYDDLVGDYATGIALDVAGDVAVVGTTFSYDFPITPNALQRRCPACANIGGSNAFVAQFSFPTPIGRLTAPPPVTTTATPTATATATVTITPTPTSTPTPQVDSKLTIAPGAINFGRVRLNDEAHSRALKIVNQRRGEAVFLESVTVSPPFALLTNNCGDTLAPGKSCTLFVTFKPTTASSYEGNLVFTTNDQVPVPQILLRGIGVSSK
jgi:hypothetical protein